MLIGKTAKKSNLETVKNIKKALRTALQLPEEVIVMVAEQACLEEDCAPRETVISLLRPDAPQLQYKIHKAIVSLEATDLLQVCSTWGFEVSETIFEPFFIPNNISRRNI